MRLKNFILNNVFWANFFKIDLFQNFDSLKLLNLAQSFWLFHCFHFLFNVLPIFPNWTTSQSCISSKFELINLLIPQNWISSCPILYSQIKMSTWKMKEPLGFGVFGCLDWKVPLKSYPNEQGVREKGHLIKQ